MICCFAFYLWKEQLLWAGLTFALLLPGAIVQVLSFMWYRADGEQRTCHLLIIHTLHLGIFKRCVRSGCGTAVCVIMFCVCVCNNMCVCAGCGTAACVCGVLSLRRSR